MKLLEKMSDFDGIVFYNKPSEITSFKAIQFFKKRFDY